MAGAAGSAGADRVDSAGRKTLAIIGAGHLGRTMGRLWHDAGLLRIGDVVTRSDASAEEAAAFIGAGRPVSAIEKLAKADLFLLATPDGALPSTCAALAAHGAFGPDSVVFHCSGALTSSALDAARVVGAQTASIHPIRSFAQPEQVLQNFAGTWCGIEGDEVALAVIAPLFERLGAKLVSIRPEAKTLYHAAAVFASNYLVTLGDAALAAYAGAGIAREDALQLIAPLMQNTLANLLAHGPEAALSGPVARGDMETVARHAAALGQSDPQLEQLYLALVERTSAVAARR
ncbi:Rossmann-like and DUF2520 domain-containing protein [Noviherbaspirillum pedocola]|uniref:DUF2520 domain-containing protein n=1 Tax=Noviherbaspirillum pedocola TaxID=2801341 RepID=A0A934SRZ9_9BURK|nr:Rossmann-like and DUF2520 domain-containing protein [Noviherbaspirillum pedocola]MBK4734512.1 DUF2520 domain-containing protein [Noviherbaspirillum pedocola]